MHSHSLLFSLGGKQSPRCHRLHSSQSTLQSGTESPFSRGQATHGLLQRAARKSGQPLIPGQSAILVPRHTSRTDSTLFTDSVQQLLQEANLYLCRHGTAPDMTNLHFPIQQVEEIPLPMVELCHQRQLHYLADLFYVHNRTRQAHWCIPNGLESLESILPSTPPSGINPLYIGQY